MLTFIKGFCSWDGEHQRTFLSKETKQLLSQFTLIYYWKHHNIMVAKRITNFKERIQTWEIFPQLQFPGKSRSKRWDIFPRLPGSKRVRMCNTILYDSNKQGLQRLIYTPEPDGLSPSHQPITVRQLIYAREKVGKFDTRREVWHAPHELACSMPFCVGPCQTNWPRQIGLPCQLGLFSSAHELSWNPNAKLRIQHGFHADLKEISCQPP